MRLFILREERHLQSMLAFLAGNWEACAKDGKPLAVQIQPEKVKRNLQQNRLYHAMLRQISEQAWIEGRQYGVDVWHEQMKRQFIGIIDLPGGASMGQSSTSLSVGEFAAFVTQVQAWATTELGVQFEEAA